eukprot:COSAG01_NODE_721_length_14068_cov_479.648436_2_plen_382_part_00
MQVVPVKVNSVAELSAKLDESAGEREFQAELDKRARKSKINIEDDGLIETDIEQLLPSNLGVDSKEAWKEMDVDGSGTVTFPEFKNWFAARKMFNEIDRDHSHTLDKQEIRQLAEQLGYPLSDAELEGAIAEMNTDEDGDVAISFREFHLWWFDAGTKKSSWRTALQSTIKQYWSRHGREIINSFQPGANLDGASADFPLDKLTFSVLCKMEKETKNGRTVVSNLRKEWEDVLAITEVLALPSANAYFYGIITFGTHSAHARCLASNDIKSFNLSADSDADESDSDADEDGQVLVNILRVLNEDMSAEPAQLEKAAKGAITKHRERVTHANKTRAWNAETIEAQAKLIKVLCSPFLIEVVIPQLEAWMELFSIFDLRRNGT